MVDQFVVVPFTTPSPSAQFDITTNAITETVKAAIVVFTRAITNDVDRTHAIMGMGIYAEDGVDQGGNPEACIASRSLHGTTSNFTAVLKANDASISVPVETNNSLRDIEYSVNSFISGGVRLDSTVATNAQVSGFVILFAGVARTFSDTIVITSSLQTENTGGTNEFTPDLVIMQGHDATFSPTPSIGSFVGTFGLTFITSDGTRGHMTTWDGGSDPTDVLGYVSTTTHPTVSAAATPLFEEGTISIVTNGFQHQRTTGAGAQSPDVMYLAVQFLDSNVQVVATNLTAPSGTGSQAYTMGFQPSLVMGMSSLQTVQDSLTNTAGASVAGYFAFDSSREEAATVRAEEGLNINPTTTEASSRHGSHALLTYEHQGTVAQQATSTLTATGFSLNFTTATSGLFTVLAIGGGSLAPLQADETVVIGDDVGFWTFLEVDTETVVIGDALGNTVTTKAVGNAPTLGTTAQARSQQGRTVGSHSELGRTEG